MNSTRIPDQQVQLADLHPGDILIWEICGAPHAAIYSPVAGKQGEIIHIYINSESKCGIFKTPLGLPLQRLTEDQQVVIIRSTKPNEGEEIAKQAEFWLHQGINFDFARLGNTFYNNAYTHEIPSVEDNIRQYLKYAARRETMPVKSRDFPYYEPSYLALLGLAMLSPKFDTCQPLSWLGMQIMNYAIDTPDRPKGLSCAGFILACIAAVKLKDVVKPVNEKTGWVSLKNSEGEGPSLEDVLVDQSAYNIEKLTELLTPAFANTNPHLPNEGFFDLLMDDTKNWQCMGTLDKTSLRKDYDKDVGRKESAEIKEAIRVNHAAFIRKFPGIFSRANEISGQEEEAPQMYFGF